MVNVAGVEVDPQIVFGVCGAVGGLVTFLNWKIENPTVAIDYVKVVRNVVLGAVSGLIVDSSAVAAFTAGLSGEFIVQNLVTKTLGDSKDVPEIMKPIVQ